MKSKLHTHLLSGYTARPWQHPISYSALPLKRFLSQVLGVAHFLSGPPSLSVEQQARFIQLISMMILSMIKYDQIVKGCLKIMRENQIDAKVKFSKNSYSLYCGTFPPVENIYKT